MKNIPIISTQNQSLTTTINDTRYDFVLRSNNGFMTYDLAINEADIITGQRIVEGQPLIPSRYLEADGNFIFIVPDSETIDWESFGNSQLLTYISSDELEFVRDGD